MHVCVCMCVCYLFSSGICSAMNCSGSVHCTIQPCLSLTLVTSDLRK